MKFLRFKNKPTNDSKRFLKELDLLTKDIEILNMMITVHEIRNTRRKKKGKEPYSIKEYMEKERKSSNSPIYYIIFFICLLIFVVPSTLDVIRSETIIDFLIFLSIQTIILGLILWFNILSPKATINCINRILKRCSEMNIDLYEYKKIVCKE